VSTLALTASADRQLAPLALTPDAARALTDEVKADAAALWSKLLALYEGGAHTVLGYSSWADYCAAEFDMSQSSAYRMLDAGRVVAELEAHSPNGDSPANEAQARALVPLLNDEVELVEMWRELRAEYGDRLTAEKVRNAVRDRLRLEQRIGSLNSSESTEWYTPAAAIAAVRAVLGAIDLDPASNAFAQRVVQATTYFDAETDGLAQPWSGRVFCNPPYGTACPKFVAKALQEFEAGNVSAAVLLLSGYSFDTQWFRPLWRHLLCFSDGRIRFYNALGEPGRPSTASVFVYLGPDWSRFAEVFGQFGAVVARWPYEERAT
jgi:DNA N-6-adenine-methyltransferase (Dam)